MARESRCRNRSAHRSTSGHGGAWQALGGQAVGDAAVQPIFGKRYCQAPSLSVDAAATRAFRNGASGKPSAVHLWRTASVVRILRCLWSTVASDHRAGAAPRMASQADDTDNPGPSEPPPTAAVALDRAIHRKSSFVISGNDTIRPSAFLVTSGQLGGANPVGSTMLDHQPTNPEHAARYPLL